MTKNFNTNIGNNDEWLTPPPLVKALGKFDLDVCEPVNPPWYIGDHGFCKNDDGLAQEWFGRVWCNPPYGKETFKWLNRLAFHGDGMALIFARTETKGFHKEVWKKADAIFFFEGRIRFHYITGEKGAPANAPSCLVAYGKNNVKALELAQIMGDIKGKFICLKK